MKKKILLITLISLLFIGKAYAKTYNNNNIIFDDKVNLESDIDSSSIIFGSNVNLHNKINGVGIIFGNDISLNIKSDYLLTFGNTIIIDGKTRDALIFGNKVVLNESSTIDRDIYIFANNVSISGSINRNIEIHAQDIYIKDAQISGNVKLRAKNINIEGNAAIIGELSYNADAKVDISDVATIGNKKIVTIKKDKKNEFVEKIKNSFISLINILLVFAILLYLFPKIFEKLDKSKKEIIKNIGKGLAFLIASIIICIILLFTVFGLSLAILLGSIYLILIYLSTIATAYILGTFIWEKLIKIEKRPYLIGIIGLIIIYLLKLIPYLDKIISIITIIVGVGSIVSLYHRKNKKEIK